MKDKISAFIAYIIAYLVVILFCALAWWFACQNFGIPFNWDQFGGVIWVALIFKWVTHLDYNDFE